MQNAEGRIKRRFCLLHSAFCIPMKQKVPPQRSGTHEGSVNPASVSDRLVDRFLDQLLGFLLVDSFDDGDLGDDEVLRAVVHLLLAEREALAALDFAEVLQDVRNILET